MPLDQRADAERLAAALASERRAATENADQPLATSAVVSVTNSPSSLAIADKELLNRSLSPWRYPAGIREQLLIPVREAKLTPPLTCDAALVDAVYLPCEQGVLIALANHTLSPIPQLKLRFQVARRAIRVESVHRGPLPFEQTAEGEIEIALATRRERLGEGCV